jgi:uncharacterized protein
VAEAAPAAPAQPSPPPPAPRPAPAPADRPAQVSPPPRAATVSPSFNCRRASSRSERMVCGSDRLASLDREMSSQFYSALSRASGSARAELRRSRDAFLRTRERCADAACVEQSYLARMDEIRAIASRP